MISNNHLTLIRRFGVQGLGLRTPYNHYYYGTILRGVCYQEVRADDRALPTTIW